MAKRVTKRERQQALQRQKRRRQLIWGIGLSGVVLLLVAAIFSLSNSSQAYAIDPTDSESVASGKQVYAAQCASCHGANLEGEENWREPDSSGLIKAPPHDETGHTWHHDDLYLVESIKKGGARLAANVGTSAMPAYEDILSEQEIAAVLAYIKSTWPADILAAQSGR